MQNCPSCGSNSFTCIGKIPREQLIAGYASPHLKVSIEKLLPPALAVVELRECESCGLKWYSPTITGDPKFYESLQRHDWYYQQQKPEYLHAAALVPPRSRVLEVGCGSGAFAAYLTQRQEYTGLEFNSEAVRRARQAGLDVLERTLESEAATRASYYDIVCHFQVLEHVENSLEFMQHCVAALRPGGTLIVTVPAEDSFLSISADGWLNMPPHHVTRWTDSALRHLFDGLGLAISEIWHEPVADFHADWYRTTIKYYAACRLLWRRPNLYENSLSARVARRLASFYRINEWLFRLGEREFTFSGRGHSVCIAGRKGEMA